MRLQSVILLLLFFTRCFAQNEYDTSRISAPTNEIVRQLQNLNFVDYDTFGLRFGPLPKDYPLTVLKKKVSFNELKEITNHSHAVIRCWAFKAIADVSEAEAFSIVIKHLEDFDRVASRYGCFLRNEYVGDFFVNVYHGIYQNDRSRLHKLDSLLIYSSTKLDARSDAFQKLSPNEIYYDRVREVLINERISGALVALAKFQKEQDVDLIMNTMVVNPVLGNHPLTKNFLAINEFPHPSFLPFLQKHLQARLSIKPSDQFFLYVAIASFDNKDAHDMLSMPFAISDKEVRSFHLEKLSRALLVHKHPIYDDLRLKLEQVSDN